MQNRASSEGQRRRSSFITNDSSAGLPWARLLTHNPFASSNVAATAQDSTAGISGRARHCQKERGTQVRDLPGYRSRIV